MFTLTARSAAFCLANSLLVLFTGSSSAIAGFNSSTTACTFENASDVRVVQVIYESATKPIPCRVMYEKSGIEQELASAENTSGFCEKTERQVVRNLVKSGWQCEHRLSGSAIAPDSQLALNLFLEDEGQGSVKTAVPHDQQLERYALVSQTLDSEQKAQNLVAEFQRGYPNLVSRVAAFGSGLNTVFRVVLGSSESREDLEAAARGLDEALGDSIYFIDNQGFSEPINYLPDDRARYVIAQCFSESQTMVADMARCSGYQLNAETLLSCLGGRSCVPEPVMNDQLSTDFPKVDLAEAIDSENPVRLARSRIHQQVERCQYLADATEKKQADCIALALLDEDQRFVVECYQRFEDVKGLLDCAGGEPVLTVVELYERCAVSRTVNIDCLLEMTNNRFVDKSVACLASELPEAVARCAILANVDTDKSKTLACLEQYEQATRRASCIASRHLEPGQAALLKCADKSPPIGEFGLCAVDFLHTGSAAQWLTTSCLLHGSVAPINLLGCAGGRFSGSEIETCLQTGTAMSSCFSNETILTQVLNKTLEQFLTADDMDWQIAEYRHELYLAEGGDLSSVLSDPANLLWLDTADEVSGYGNDQMDEPGESKSVADGFKRFGVEK